MNISIHKAATVAAVALALPLAVMAPPAQAALVTTWSYDVDTAFDGFSEENPGFGPSTEDGTGVEGSVPNADLAGRPTVYSWGAEGGSLVVGDGSSPEDSRSSISVTPERSGNDLVTNGGSVAGATFTHTNNTILDGAIFLSTADILNRVVLTPFVPLADDPADGREFIFGVNFEETTNTAPCPGASVSTCDDIFVLTSSPGSDATPVEGGFAYDFTYESILYTVILQIDGLGPLGEDACTVAGAPGTCRGVLTPEEAISDVLTSFSISALVPDTGVPEPGTLSIMALGLICLALAGISRQRRAG